MINRRGRSALVANHQGLFQVPISLLCDSICVAKSFKAPFVNFLARWLFARGAPDANPAFMNVVDLWGARVPTYNKNALMRYHRYKHVVESCLWLAIGAKDM